MENYNKQYGLKKPQLQHSEQTALPWDKYVALK